MDFPLIEKHITLAKMRTYTGGGPGIHTDDEFARAKGLPGAVVQGGQIVGYLNEMMLRALGQGYIEGGEITVVFVKSALAGDNLSTKATVTEKQEVDGRTRVECEVWVENQRGEKLAVGTASGFQP